MDNILPGNLAVSLFKGTKIVACLLTGFLTQSALAATPLPLSSLYGQWTFQLGGFYAHEGKSQDIGIVDLIGDHFTVTQQNRANVLVGLGYYINGFCYRNVNFMYGLNAYYFAHTVVKGNVVQEDAFTNLSYKYDINNYPLYAVLKGFLNSFGPKYTITFDVGLGANFIQANHFREASLDGITLPDNVFSSNTTTAFSASLAAGVQFNNLLNGANLELGYRFFYLGEGKFNKQTNQLLNTLKTGNAYANALILSLSI